MGQVLAVGGMKAIVQIIIIALTLAAHAETTNTDLGKGNAAVARRFAEYIEKRQGCEANQSGLPRVMLSGFGLFSGAQFNISGAVIDNLSRDLPFHDDARGILSDADLGARVVNKILRLPSGPVSACLLLLDVQWDLAAAVLAYEMDRFQPEVLIMSGRGSLRAIIEAGAQNKAVAMHGYNPDGSPNLENRPIAQPILAGESEFAEMTWNQGALAERTRGLIEAQGAQLQLPTEARWSNDYICNNVSYAVLKAAEGRPLVLAGGELVLSSRLNEPARIGFFHYPYDVQFTETSILAWSEILLNLADASLSSRGW